MGFPIRFGGQLAAGQLKMPEDFSWRANTPWLGFEDVKGAATLRAAFAIQTTEQYEQRISIQ